MNRQRHPTCTQSPERATSRRHDQPRRAGARSRRECAGQSRRRGVPAMLAALRRPRKVPSPHPVEQAAAGEGTRERERRAERRR